MNIKTFHCVMNMCNSNVNYSTKSSSSNATHDGDGNLDRRSTKSSWCSEVNVPFHVCVSHLFHLIFQTSSGVSCHVLYSDSFGQRHVLFATMARVFHKNVLDASQLDWSWKNPISPNHALPAPDPGRTTLSPASPHGSSQSIRLAHLC